MNHFTRKSTAELSTEAWDTRQAANRSAKSQPPCSPSIANLVSYRPKSDSCLDTVALVLAGGRGSRLHPLTRNRCKPAVPFGGTFKIVDFALSNCINSGIRQIGVLTQYSQHSLIQHLNEAWSFLRRDLHEFIDVLPAQQHEGAGWYCGTADAVSQNISLLQQLSPRTTLIVAGDHIYKADYRRMIQQHIESGAGLTVSCCAVPLTIAPQFGIVKTNEAGRIIEFEEKPTRPAQMQDRAGFAQASMGVYVFDTELLIKVLQQDSVNSSSAHDFGRDIIPALIDQVAVHSYQFDSAQAEHYWRDVGTVDGYYEANLQLLDPMPSLDLHDPDWSIHTRAGSSCPARFVVDSLGHSGLASDCIVASGCLLRGSRIRHSILFSDVQVDEQSQIEDSLVLPGARIGKRCRIRDAIIDSNTQIADGTEIGYDRQHDALHYHVTERGIVVVTAPISSQPLLGTAGRSDQFVTCRHHLPLQVHG